MDPDFFAAQLREVVRKELQAQDIAEPARSNLVKLHAEWEAQGANRAGARSKAFHQLQESVLSELGEVRYGTYRRRLDEHFARLYLTPA
jgi:hypothetical protein